MTDLFIATGAESSGKSTLCNQLSHELTLPLVSEAARGYLDARIRLNNSFRYTRNDLLNIAQIQHAAETMSHSAGQLPLICDTDLLVLIVWSEEKYKEVTPWITQAFHDAISSQNRHYLLCHWDIPWEADPLREHADDRERLFSIYESKLQQFELPFTVLKGDAEARLAQATTLIQNNISR